MHELMYLFKTIPCFDIDRSKRHISDSGKHLNDIEDILKVNCRYLFVFQFLSILDLALSGVKGFSRILKLDKMVLRDLVLVCFISFCFVLFCFVQSHSCEIVFHLAERQEVLGVGMYSR